MSFRFALALTCAVFPIAKIVPAAETGDLDGDGLVTLADFRHVIDGLPPAPGSMQGLEQYPCGGWHDVLNFPGAIFLEAVRRSVPDPLPAWWTHVWASAPRTPPLPEDARVAVRLERAVAAGGGSDVASLELVLTNLAPVRAFFLVLEADGDVLRPGMGDPATPPRDRFTDEGWMEGTSSRLFVHGGGDLQVAVTAASHLITNGRLVVAYGAPFGQRNQPILEPGDRRISIQARVPRRTRPGSYPVRLTEGSQVLLDPPGLMRPAAGILGDLVVESEVMAGWDGGVPPFAFDAATRTVRGQVEFRLADADGNPAQPGDPVAAALPGEPVSVRVQMRTEVPLNHLFYRLEWPTGAVLCSRGWSFSAEVLFTDPGDGSIYPSRDCSSHPSAAVCSDGAFGRPPWHEASFFLAGAAHCGSESDHPDRPAEYFRPLGEWVDLTRLDLVIPPGAVGGERIPLAFRERDLLNPELGVPRAEFVPYSGDYLCPHEFQTGSPNWSYDVRLESGFVEVLGDSPGEDPDPPGGGIRVFVGSATGAPGAVVDLPLLAAARLPPATLRIALELDPDAVAVDEVDMAVSSPMSGETVRLIVPRGQGRYLEECTDENGDEIPERCAFGHPFLSAFEPTAPRFVLLHITPGIGPPYPGEALREIARLRVKVLEGATGAETVIRPAIVLWDRGAIVEEVVTGGFYLRDGRQVFAPAEESAGGTVTITGRGFLRGDANGDSRVDLSDAVATLGYLFLGAVAPGCLDAADADDSGKLEITDPVFLLGTLFLGAGRIPEPYPGCGSDGTIDGLGCKESC